GQPLPFLFAQFPDLLARLQPLAFRRRLRQSRGMTDRATIAANLAGVRSNIDAAARIGGRTGAPVTLVAVATAPPSEAVAAALSAGQTVFGENRVQEAAAKYPALRHAHPELVLHLIGPLQTNKVRDAVELFDVIETIDREKLARALATEMQRQQRQPRL